MRQTTFIFAALIFLNISLIAFGANAQQTATDITQFMTGIGWKVSELPGKSALNKDDNTSFSYYQFSSDFKYAIVGFNVSGMATTNLEVTTKKGKRFKKDYDTNGVQKIFQLPFNCSVLIFNPEIEEELRIVTYPLNSTNIKVGEVVNSEYLIFYR